MLTDIFIIDLCLSSCRDVIMSLGIVQVSLPSTKAIVPKVRRVEAKATSRKFTAGTYILSLHPESLAILLACLSSYSVSSFALLSSRHSSPLAWTPFRS